MESSLACFLSKFSSPRPAIKSVDSCLHLLLLLFEGLRVSSLIASSWVTRISPTCSSSVQKISSLWVFWFSGQMLPLKQLSKLCMTDDSPSVSSFQGRSSSSSAHSFYASLPSLGCRWCPWCGYYRRLDGYYMHCRVIQTGAHLMIRRTTTTTALCVSRRREKNILWLCRSQ